MFGKSKDSPPKSDSVAASGQQLQHSAGAHSAAASESPETISSISSGTSIVGKIVADGTVKIFGRIEGDLRASSVLISNGAQVEGDVVADELMIGGHVKGTIHANRVKLNNTAVVEGDIFHRSLVIEENARFQGSSRREENVIDTPSRVQPNRPHAQGPAASIDSKRKHTGPPDGEGHAKPTAE